ncbi:acyl-CoA dehydrogenase [Lichenicoccus roseus]|uniref:Acyl-CoA dehydrogenase n=1 Tax=Lichenicoccus roseus TaxID=2683649 RepID=A0A5R9J8G3_9PROT|nr:acyl-CoA dehydrogenase [Lichenicoccus roseus]
MLGPTSPETEPLDGIALIEATDRTDLQHLVARFASRAARHDETATTSRENLADLQAAGLLALTVPHEAGGGGGGLAAAANVVGRVAEGDPSTALILSMQYLQHAAVARSTQWPERLRAVVARAAVEDGALLNALRVEPDLGTPARGGLPATVARRTGDGWAVTGSKIYSTGSTVLRWGVVWARTDEDAPRVGGFLVPMDAPGVSIERSWNQLGMRATESHTVHLDDVRLPPDHAADIRPPAAWGAPDPVQSVWGSIVIASLYDGVARAARRWLLGFLRDRAPTNLGAPLATLPRFQEIVGEIDALLLANRLILAAAIAEEAAGGTTNSAQGGLVKHLVTENAIRAVEKALAATGNPGLSRDNPLERHYRDVLCARVHTPQADVSLGLSGRLSLAAAP